MSENKKINTEEVETPYTVVQLTEALEERQKPLVMSPVQR